MIASLAALLQVRPGEGRLALLGSGFFFLVQAAQTFGANAGDALLFARFGVDVLPVLFILLGATTLVATVAYTAVLGRPDRARLSVRTLWALALVGVPAWGASFVVGALLYPFLWLVLALANALMGTLVWVLVGEACDPRSSKRLFNLFASAGILGTVLAGAVTGLAARAVGTESLLLLYAALGFGGGLLARRLAVEFARTGASSQRRLSPADELRQAHRWVWSNPTMRLTAASAVVFSILFFSLTFPFNVEVAAAFPDAAELAGFLGVFGSVVTATTFVVSLLLAGRAFARIGVINALLLLPLAYLLGFSLWIVRLDLITAAAVRFVQLVLLGGLASSAYGALFNVVPADRRAQVRAYQSGPPAQAGVMLSGILILLGQRGMSAAQALGIGVFFSAVAAALVWRMRSSYGASLVDALRAGVVEVFSGAESRFASLARDPQARRVAAQGLSDARPEVRRISLGLLAEMDAVEASGAVAALRDDPSVAVRSAAASTLGRLRPASGEEFIPFLEDPAPAVRTAAIRAAASSDVFRGNRLDSLLSDPDPTTRAEAAILASRGDRKDAARDVIRGLLQDPRVEMRLAGLRACAEAEGLDATQELLDTLRSGPAALRVAAAEALARRPTSPGIRALIELLDDPDSRVRQAGVIGLRGIRESSEPLLVVLESGSPLAQEGALASLAGRNGATRAALLRWSAQRIPEVQRLRTWRRALANPPGSKTEHTLGDWLDRSAWKTTQMILRGLAASGAGDSIRLISRALRSPDGDLKAQAIEALDSTGDRQITRGLIDLLETNPADLPVPDPDQALEELASHPRPWFRVLALRALAERLTTQWDRLAEQVRADAAGIVRQAWPIRPGPSSGDNMIETSQTLGVVERVLCLRDVPVFRLLEPEDLERIASLAQERLHAAGEWLCEEGDVGDELFVVVEGKVEVVRGEPNNRRFLRTLSAGEQFGELAILREQPRSAGVRALSQVRTLVLSGAALRSILEERPEVSLSMLESLAERLSTLG